jgi:hypothetical protein
MSHLNLCALVALAIGLSTAGLAHAQPGLSTKPNYDAIYNADRIDEYTQRELTVLHDAATKALDAQDYAAAETTLGQLVSRRPTTRDAFFLMGLAKSGLGKWEEARTSLEAAVLSEPKRPEPKTRLGLAYARLANFDGARKLRADLAVLAGDCKQTCPDATWIADGLKALDEALAPGAQPAVLAGASVAPAAPIAETTGFDPRKYNLVSFDDSRDLYDLLTQAGRCAPKQLAEPRQPCALILYQPDETIPGALAANFKPVFSVVSRTEIWAIHDKKLQRVKIEDLYFDQQEIIGQKQAAYRSVALIGNAENKANCDKALPCLTNLVVQDMFRMYGSMPDSVVEVIWGSGMKDPGTVRIQ